MGKARQAVLLRALDILGDREGLSRAIRVRPVVLDGWLSGEIPIPEAAFLKAADIVQVDAVSAWIVNVIDEKAAA